MNIDNKRNFSEEHDAICKANKKAFMDLRIDNFLTAQHKLAALFTLRCQMAIDDQLKEGDTESTQTVNYVFESADAMRKINELNTKLEKAIDLKSKLENMDGNDGKKSKDK